ncbi:MFS transporter [Streptomyces sp. NPDC057565]|uniref:MFS transporter n=1 Tax=Streptomyces sp. NPDC057565 TaxID=3346169 RepID=UPI003681BB0E
MLTLIDGFDVSVMAYAAPSLSHAWRIDAVTLGYLLSAGLFGMAAGSVILTPAADRIGRRKLTLLSMTIVSLGMVLSVFSQDAAQLMAFRALTGLGVGGMMANLNVLVSEYASDKSRGSVIGIYAAGYPIGATTGGFAANPLIAHFDWRAVFVTGAALSVIMLVISWRCLPESLDFLLTRRPADVLGRTNAILAKLGHPALTELPARQETQRPQGAARQILTRPTRSQTLKLWAGYGCLVAAYYFANTWMPKIMASVSGDDALGVTVGTVANLGGIIGCFLFSALARRWRSRLLLAGALTAATVSYALFGQISGHMGVAMAVVALLGLLTTAAIAGFYTVAPGVYTPAARATGMGWMIGIGRLVSITAPILVGYLLSGGWAPQKIFFLFTVPLLASLLCVVALRKPRPRERSPEPVAVAAE